MLFLVLISHFLSLFDNIINVGGYLGQVQSIIKSKTECFECKPKPAAKGESFILCSRFVSPLTTTPPPKKLPHKKKKKKTKLKI